jgi:hypothetical protein
MRVLALILILGLSGCGIKPPKPTPCTIINSQLAQCVPTDTSQPIYDQPIKQMRGFMCFAQDDIADIKIYVKELLEAIDNE